MWRLTVIFCCSILPVYSTFTMSKQPAKRKKTSEDDAGSGMNILANLDISDKSITPKIVAKALLSLLPDDATKQHSSAKKLVSLLMYKSLVLLCIYLCTCNVVKYDLQWSAIYIYF